MVSGLAWMAAYDTTANSPPAEINAPAAISESLRGYHCDDPERSRRLLVARPCLPHRLKLLDLQAGNVSRCSSCNSAPFYYVRTRSPKY